MKSNNTQEYSLSELFSTANRKIIIPDFQRDYCWGDKTHGKNNIDIVSSFLDTLIEEFDTNKESDIQLGKIDIYEHPKNHIYLTDGQQRLTTLYLLIGMLHRKEQKEEVKNKLKRCIVSNFEENQDDKELYLQYAVRESTVFFMRDLVNEFFLKNNSLKIANIENQPWFFNEYRLDPSISSMLSALRIIETKNKNFKEGFSEFVIEKIKIQYYDVKDKKHGEERFVIINTTGKSLTVSENIKPILLGNTIGFGQQWEERETYFWKNRNKEKENIADNGVNDFLTWCFQIIDKQDEIDLVKKAKQLLKENKNQRYLKEIQKLFNALKQLIEYLKEDKFQSQFKFINENGNEVKSVIDFRNLLKEKQQNVLLPLIAFISKFQNESEATCQFLRRLRKNYFDFIWEDRKANYVDWRYVLQIIEKSNSIDEVFQFETNENPLISIQNVPLNNWFNEEEKIKCKLSEHKQFVEEWEDTPEFMGDLSFLIQSSLIHNKDSEIPQFSQSTFIEVEKIKILYENYKNIIGLIRSEEKAQKDTKLANMFRLFRLFIGCNKVEHIYRASWDFEGVLFSTLNREHLFKVDFMKLLNAENLLSYCIGCVKQKVTEQNIFDLADFTTDKFIKAWLTLKVFYANDQNKLLVFYDGKETGVAAYNDRDSNKLIDREEFSLANSICGFGVKSGFGKGNYVHYTDKELWCNPDIIDTPFVDIAYEKENRTKEQLNKNKEKINEIIYLIQE